MYLFFSSDAHDLFKDAILHALAYPAGYCDQFRYEFSIVPDEIKNNLDALIDKDGLIVYAKGNDVQIQDIKQRQITFHAIRKVKVKAHKSETSTGLIHFFLELNEFVEMTIPFPTGTDDVPAKMFVAKNDTVKVKEITWVNAVKKLIDFDTTLKEILFFNLTLQRKGRKNKVIHMPEFDPNEHSSFYLIDEGSTYFIDVALYNTTNDRKLFGKFYLNTTKSTDDIVFSNLSNLTIGTDIDNRVLRFSTKVLKAIRSAESLVFKSLRKDASDKEQIRYEIDIRIDTRKTITNTLIYSTLIFFAVVSAFLLAYVAFELKEGRFPWCLIGGAFACSIISSTGLFYFFNKN